MPTKAATAPARNVASEIAFLTRALKAPSLAAAVERLADRARPSRGRMRSSWPRVCSGRSPPGSLTAVKAGSVRRVSRPAKPWRTSTSTINAHSNATPSRIWAPWISSLPRKTSCSSDHPAPGKPTCRSGSGSAHVRPDTGWRSPPPRNGSPASPTPTTPAASKTNSSNSAASRY